METCAKVFLSFCSVWISGFRLPVFGNLVGYLGRRQRVSGVAAGRWSSLEIPLLLFLQSDSVRIRNVLPWKMARMERACSSALAVTQRMLATLHRECGSLCED